MKNFTNLTFLLIALFTFIGTGTVEAQFNVPEGAVISLQSVNYPDRMIRHAHHVGKLTPIVSDLDKKDSQFKVVAALNGASDCISFESVNYPGQFLRHQGYVVKLNKKEDGQLYKDDASWRPKKGLTGQGYSFEGAKFPNFYLRHSGFNMLLNKNDGSALFHKDATFTVNQKNTLAAGESLAVDEMLVSANGAYKMIMQTDGNVCVYTIAGGFQWCTMAHGFKQGRLDMQTDGNLVVYNGEGGADVKWASETHPFNDAKWRDSNLTPTKLVLENDGKMNLYNATGSVVWSNK